MPFVSHSAGTVQGVGLPHFLGWLNIFFYFGYSDLSLTTQKRFRNLTILNTDKQRTDKLCLAAVTSESVALI